MAKKTPLTLTGKPLKNYNHEKFAQKIAESIMTPGKPVNQSAIYNEVYGVTKDVASSGACVLIAKPEIKERVQDVLNANGLTIDRLTKKLTALTEAKKKIYFNGKCVDVVDDLDIQTKANKLGFELQRALPNQTELNSSISIDNRQINLELGDSKNIDKLAMIAQTFLMMRTEKQGRTGLVKATQQTELKSDDVIDAEFKLD